MYQFIFATHAVTSHGEWVTPQNAERHDYDSLFCLYCRLKIVVHIDPLTGTREFVHSPGQMSEIPKLKNCWFSKPGTIPEEVSAPSRTSGYFCPTCGP